MSLVNISTNAELARALSISEQVLISQAFHLPDTSRYSTLELLKRSGEKRVIRKPKYILKTIQKRLLPLLEQIYRPNSRAHGYIKGRGLRTNASPHLAKRFVFNTDLINFFGTIHFGRIRGRLLKPPYNLTNAVATTIAKLVTCEEVLPLGAPTSPIISNLMLTGLDSALGELAKKYGCFYTRYADDLSFSTNRKSFPRAIAESDVETSRQRAFPGPELVQAVTSQGFQLNLDKTRLLSRADRQEVCGVVCNERLNPLPKLRRQIRACLHAWRRYAYEAAEQEWKAKFNYASAQSFEQHLRGKIEYLRYIRGTADPLVNKYAQQFNELRRIGSPISVVTTQDWQHTAEQSSCCIHSYMMGASDRMVQGSGFVVDGGYIVTNYHVVKNDLQAFDVIQLRFPGTIDLDIAVHIVAELRDKDLALLQPVEVAWRESIKKRFLQYVSGEPSRHDIVWLTGWPHYNDGDDIHLVQGTVIGFSTLNGIRMFRITQSIIFGNSGGAVLDENGRVVGIATRGSDIDGAPTTVHNGCVPASYIDDLLKRVSSN